MDLTSGLECTYNFTSSFFSCHIANLILFWHMMYKKYVSKYSIGDIIKLLHHHYYYQIFVISTLQNIVDDLLTQPVEHSHNIGFFTGLCKELASDAGHPYADLLQRIQCLLQVWSCLCSLLSAYCKGYS